jgi:hypothetical protein
MALSLEKSALSGALGLAGGGAIMIWPQQWWIGVALIICAALIIVSEVKRNGVPWWQTIPKPQNPFRHAGTLYVGRLTVDDSALQSAHLISISALVFNATNRRVSANAFASGQVQITMPSGLGIATITPAVPTVVPQSAAWIGPGHESGIALQLHLTPADVQAYSHNVTGNTVSFLFDQLLVEVETERHRRVPVRFWDGATLRDGRVTNRIVNVGISEAVGVKAS